LNAFYKHPSFYSASSLRKSSRWLIACYLLVLSTLSLAIAPTKLVSNENNVTAIVLDKINEQRNVYEHLNYLIDGSFDATIWEVIDTPNHKWKKNIRQSHNFGQIKAPLWFHLELTQPFTPSNKQYYLNLNYPHHDEVSVYFVNHNNVIKKVNTGDHHPFFSRETELPTFTFQIPKNYQRLDVFIRVQSEGVLRIPLSIVTEDELRKQSNSFGLLTGLYFGAILIMLIYNTFIYITVKDRSYLYYLIYLFSCASIQLVLSGLAFQYIWPEVPAINNYAVILSATFVGVSAITFIKNFIGIEYVSSKRDDILIKLVIIAFILVAFSSFIISYSVALSATFLAVTTMVIVGFYLGVKYWLKGIKTARYFALAWFSYLSAVIVFMLAQNQFIDSNVFTDNAISIGTLIELSLLSIAFADKLNYEKNLRVEAQDALLDVQIKMNEDLDKIVEARTEALEDANTRLKELSVTDSLTKLKNRYYLDQAFKKEIHRSARDGSSLSVVMIDIDYFKKINDQYGHLFGDFCLTKASQLIQSVVNRPSDTVARYGGEEIAILLPNTPLDGAMKLAEKVREQFRETEFQDSDISCYLTVSIGVSTASPEVHTIKHAIKLLDIADQCLYQAKEGGRDQVVGKKCYFD
jgi:diguanylate cyclase (GGDEF)-like protein